MTVDVPARPPEPKGSRLPWRRRHDILTHEGQHHPTVVAVAARHARSGQLRVAEAITAFAGSMTFVYLHIAIFIVWCATGLFGLDRYPFQFLTLAVSLEAIFLSAFVLIGQNRQADFQQQKADRDFSTQEKELDENTELTRQIHRLTVEMHTIQQQIQQYVLESRPKP